MIFACAATMSSPHREPKEASKKSVIRSTHSLSVDRIIAYCRVVEGHIDELVKGMASRFPSLSAKAEGPNNWDLTLASSIGLDKSLSVKDKRVLMGNVGCSRILIVWVACILSVLSAFWLNPKLKVFLEGEYWEAMGRFDESLRLTHAECIDENQSGFNDLVERAIRGMVSGLDRHSSYYPPVEYKAFQDDTYNRYVGIGVMIRKVEKGVLLTKVFPRGPAYVAGIKPELSFLSRW